ncbi:hypothetical protein [Methanosphaerula subterraneus]|uniref:hypothetical protein n=1 Tax=Methanosphaerula subterraneus TaxID=3350244 RepID=UPI003F85C395
MFEKESSFVIAGTLIMGLVDVWRSATAHESQPADKYTVPAPLSLCEESPLAGRVGNVCLDAGDEPAQVRNKFGVHLALVVPISHVHLDEAGAVAQEWRQFEGERGEAGTEVEDEGRFCTVLYEGFDWVFDEVLPVDDPIPGRVLCLLSRLKEFLVK